MTDWGLPPAEVRRYIGRRIGDALVEVCVSRRAIHNAPIVVTQTWPRHIGTPYRYSQHVMVETVVNAVDAWMQSLPDDYCASGNCPDQIEEEWRRCKQYLGRVQCVGSWGDVLRYERADAAQEGQRQ